MKNIKKIIKFIKDNKWASILFEISIIVAILWAFSWYQNRGTLAANEQPAPNFNLKSLSGENYQLSDLKGKKVVVYFFAPWCNVCHLSASNLNDLREARTNDELEILAVGLSYEYPAEIQDFANELQLNIPVLYGTNQQMEDYQIKGFPTYFVIDEDGRVTHRSVGYSTEIGLRLRT
ncbi:MAG: TlpA disulfide reductase family protein [Gammaproteobacteria bacterium]|jgi:peroxiredoxin|nr:TlpA family protein disulfide reductase [Xanthomonadales bacterium]MCB1604763.1 TlpA family protein disulfide reductase [Xanthomonadales bacterium]